LAERSVAETKKYELKIITPMFLAVYRQEPGAISRMNIMKAHILQPHKAARSRIWL